MGMDKYMGYWAKEQMQATERELPKIEIKGTEFFIDLLKHEFRQVDDPFNRMALGNVPEEMGFSHMLYDTGTKNRYLGETDNGSKIPFHVCIVLIPPLKDLDPTGLARRQGIPPEKQNSMTQSLTTFQRENDSPKKKRKACKIS